MLQDLEHGQPSNARRADTSPLTTVSQCATTDSGRRGRIDADAGVCRVAGALLLGRCGPPRGWHRCVLWFGDWLAIRAVATGRSTGIGPSPDVCTGCEAGGGASRSV